MGRVELYDNRGRPFVIDVADFDRVWPWRWRSIQGGYLRANVAGRLVYLHRYLLDAPKSHLVDHVNRDTRDNRQENLRLATHSENNRNRIAGRNNSSGLKGVSIDRRAQRRGHKCIWQASIRLNYQSQYLGHYATAEEAHAAYCEAAKGLHGTFARFGEQS